jgi:DNA-3-methyladenine glycosylase II
MGDASATPTPVARGAKRGAVERTPLPKRARTGGGGAGAGAGAGAGTSAGGSKPPRKSPAKAAPKAGKEKANLLPAQKKISSRLGADLDAASPVLIAALDMPTVLAVLSKADPKLGAVIRQIGPPTSLVTKLGGDPFTALCRSIIFQQLSTTAAGTIFNRMVAACKCADPSGAGEFSPASVLAAPAAALRKAGLSGRKVEYSHNLANEFASGRITRQSLEAMSCRDVMTTLCAIKGIGEWSVHMLMMFSLGRANVLPVGDLAVRKAFRRLYSVSQNMSALSDTAVAEHVDLPNAAQLHALADSWRPYRTIGSWYMWHVVETAHAAYTY